MLRAGRRLIRQQGRDQQALTLGLKAVFFVFVVVVAVWLVRAVAMLLIGLLDVRRADTIRGQVLRLRRRQENDRGLVTHVAVDDGDTTHVRAWVPANPPPGLSQGRWVRAVVSPRLGFVRTLEMLPSASGGSAAPATAAVDRGAISLTSDGPGPPAPGLHAPEPATTVRSASRPPSLSSLDAAWLSQLVGVPLAADTEHGAGFVAQFSGPGAHLTATVAPSGMGSELFQQVARVPHIGRSAVQGVGDEAWWIMRSTLVARRGDDAVVVGARVKSLDGEQRLRIATEIAQRILNAA